MDGDEKRLEGRKKEDAALLAVGKRERGRYIDTLVD